MRHQPGDLEDASLRCEQAHVLLSRELDRELRSADRERLEAHLASCSACARERAELAQADGWLQDALSPETFGADLVRDVVRAIEVRQARPAATRPAAPRGVLVAFRAAGLVAASAAAVLFVAFAMGSLGGPSSSGTVERGPALPVVVAKAYGKGLRVSAPSEPGVHGGRAPARLLTDGEVVHADEHILNASGPGTIFLGEPTRVAAFSPDHGMDPELTRIDLRADTSLAFHVERDGGLTISFPENTGVAFFEVSKQERPFRVATPALTATVVGTKFLVSATSESSLVSVVEGHVHVMTSNQHGVDLSARQEAFFASSQGTLLARPTQPRALLAWNPRALAALPAEPSTAPAPLPAPVHSPLDPKPAPKPAIDPNLDTPIK